MFESPVKQSLSQSPEGARRQVAIVSTVFYLYSPVGVTCLAPRTPCRLGIANFPYPLLLSAVAGGQAWKSFSDPKTRVFQAVDGEDLVIVACTVFD